MAAPAGSGPAPRVSVVVPTFDRAAVIERAARSVLAQSFEDLELVVVDDGSRDDTGARLAALGDRRLHLLRNPANLGYPHAFNRGLAAARGALVAFQDSDDEWLPGKLAAQVERFDRDPALAVVHTGWVVARKEPQPGPELLPGTAPIPGSDQVRPEGAVEASSLARLLAGNVFAASGAVVRRDVLAGAGGLEPSLPCLQDWDLWLRLARQGAPFALVPGPLVRVHLTPGGVNDAGDAALAAALAAILARHGAAFAGEPRLLAKHEHVVGHLLCRSGDVAAGRPWLTRAAHRDRRLKHVLRAGAARLGAGPYRALERLRRHLGG